LTDTSYVVAAIDNNGCVNLDTIDVIIRPLPDVTISQNISTGCAGSPVMLSVPNTNTGYNIRWINVTAGNTTIATNTVNTAVTTEATYKVVITNPTTMCSDSSTKFVDFINPPSAVTIIAPDSNCINEPIILIAAASGDSLKYHWASTGSGVFSDTLNDTTSYMPDPLDATPVDFTLTVWNSCDTLTDTEDVVLKPAPVGSYTYAPTENFVQDTVFFTNTSDTALYNIIDWNWDFRDGTTDTAFHPIHIYTQPGIYNVNLVVTNNFGCRYTYSVPVDIIKTQVIFIPNVFSPLANNLENRTCKVYGVNISNNEFSFKVFNRWGEVVYETNNFTEANTIGWDGNNPAKEPQSMGVFTYTLKGQWMDGKPFEKTGTVTLIR
ncbi:MAG: gliding motility-associated C-terminal domain-containing protein, partial [Cytophagaceae bacterium]|nr:gliding motility-associated C-terminal domain-containing protein [Cytophagaceae bacterium]